MENHSETIDADGIRHLEFPLPLVPNGNSIPAAVEQALRASDGQGLITLLINDPQRHINTAAVLAEIARRQDTAKIRILVACGSHRFSAAQQQAFERSTLGDLKVEDFAWHDCRSPQLARLGDQWRCHPWLLEDRPVVAIGSVEPHYFAGFTGAHKTATVGCMSFRDLESNHAHALSIRCRPCRLERNPVYEDITRIMSTLLAHKPVSVVNLVQVGPQVIAAYGGNPFDTLLSAAPVAKQAFASNLEAPLDALIAHVDGPLGRSFYQAEKGIKNNEWALRDGGCLILKADCDDGIGQSAFVELLQQAPTYQQAIDIVGTRGYHLGDHKAVRLRYLTDKACRGVHVFIVSPNISDQQASILGLTKAPDVAQALRQAGMDPHRQRVCAITDAGNHCLIPAETLTVEAIAKKPTG